jgi:hypothetical protein
MSQYAALDFQNKELLLTTVIAIVDMAGVVLGPIGREFVGSILAISIRLNALQSRGLLRSVHVCRHSADYHVLVYPDLG